MAARPLDPSRPVEIYDTTQSALEKAIMGAAARQQAIAQNLANVDTPGYQRVDVDFHGALAAAMCSGDDSRTAVEGVSFSAAKDASAGATRADGSTVDVDAESAKLAANALDQEAAVSVAKTRIAILRSAMGVG